MEVVWVVGAEHREQQRAVVRRAPRRPPRAAVRRGRWRLAIVAVTTTTALSGAGRVGAVTSATGTPRGTAAAAASQHREVTLTAPAVARRAVRITNTDPGTVTFRLTHNGHVAFTSLDEIADTVRRLPDEIPGEPLERKLWRFVRDNVYHEDPLNESTWLHATWPVLNSAGWGFCSHVSAIYVQIARRLGLQARIWNYAGHVAPEVYTGGAWHEYDPDLAVYYFTADGRTVAGAELLQAHPDLITAPVHPIFAPGENDEAYRPELARIYGTLDDNHVTDEFTSPEPFHGSAITLPAGATFLYPGRWTGPITGLDGTTRTTITQIREARLDLPAGFTGTVDVPFLLRSVQGRGTVTIGTRTFTTGTGALDRYLIDPGRSVTTVDVTRNPSGISLVMLINPLWFDTTPHTTITLDAATTTNTNNTADTGGVGVAALHVDTVDLPPRNRPPGPVPATARKPVARP